MRLGIRNTLVGIGSTLVVGGLIASASPSNPAVEQPTVTATSSPEVLDDKTVVTPILAPTPTVTIAPTLAPATPRPTVAAAAPAAPNCDPNYSGCVPIASDVDCAGGSGNGPAYVQGPIRVIGYDKYGLDRDGDGIACE